MAGEFDEQYTYLPGAGYVPHSMVFPDANPGLNSLDTNFYGGGSPSIHQMMGLPPTTGYSDSAAYSGSSSQADSQPGSFDQFGRFMARGNAYTQMASRFPRTAYTLSQNSVFQTIGRGLGQIPGARFIGTKIANAPGISHLLGNNKVTVSFANGMTRKMTEGAYNSAMKNPAFAKQTTNVTGAIGSKVGLAVGAAGAIMGIYSGIKSFGQQLADGKAGTAMSVGSAALGAVGLVSSAAWIASHVGIKVAAMFGPPGWIAAGVIAAASIFVGWMKKRDFNKEFDTVLVDLFTQGPEYLPKGKKMDKPLEIHQKFIAELRKSGICGNGSDQQVVDAFSRLSLDQRVQFKQDKGFGLSIKDLGDILIQEGMKYPLPQRKELFDKVTGQMQEMMDALKKPAKEGGFKRESSGTSQQGYLDQRIASLKSQLGLDNAAAYQQYSAYPQQQQQYGSLGFPGGGIAYPSPYGGGY